MNDDRISLNSNSRYIDQVKERKSKNHEWNLNGTLWNRIEGERENLMEEEMNYKRQLENISGFGKHHLIPIGRLQRLDESDSESEPSLETEGSPRSGEGVGGGGGGGEMRLNERRLEGMNEIEEPIRIRWREEEEEESEGLRGDSIEMRGVDLDEGLEDLDQPILDDDDDEEEEEEDHQSEERREVNVNSMSEDGIEGESRLMDEDELRMG
ncbi:hypothetical protein DFH28DRAFT_931964 [Melampsora americana]|nr:hypothetical protein DFH28DRAFT_931964 [Melampsora americana]